MKGIILSGGNGTRLYPSTNIISKQLLPVYDKPMIYYPLSTLMLAGIKEVAIISTPRDLPNYQMLLGGGTSLGIEISYFEQPEPRGLADAFLVCESFIKDENVALILGDNIFYGNTKFHEIVNNFSGGAMIFGYPVQNPERYGVLDFDRDGGIKGIIEKPIQAPSNYAVPGFYLYDNTVVSRAKRLKPSERGEIEITDLNVSYLSDSSLNVQLLGRGIAWFDTGTSKSLVEASAFLESVESVQSYKIGCIEEISLRKKFINLKSFDSLLEKIPPSQYKDYLLKIRPEFSSDSNLSSSTIERLQS
ncbi:MAG: glucose-1-phosphate thymidylyltransferase [Halobacteriovoraceae bacterium]|nr:glucose-1-phosphate thymidylyltransferase [Halobacteriovoraceae bacterium]